MTGKKLVYKVGDSMKRKLILIILIVIIIIVTFVIQVIPQNIQVRVNNHTVTLSKNEVYEMLINIPTEPLFNYSNQRFLRDRIETQNIDGIFKYTITVKNIINQTSTFTIKQHIYHKEALIICDVQNYSNNYLHIASVMNNINDLIDQARVKNIPIVIIKNLSFLNDYGLRSSEIHDSLNVSPADNYIAHHVPNAFSETSLFNVLQELDVKKLYFAGVGSSTTISQTARDALKKHYEVVLISDAHTDSVTNANGTISIINRIFKNAESSNIMQTDDVQFTDNEGY